MPRGLMCSGFPSDRVCHVFELQLGQAPCLVEREILHRCPLECTDGVMERCDELQPDVCGLRWAGSCN